MYDPSGSAVKPRRLVAANISDTVLSTDTVGRCDHCVRRLRELRELRTLAKLWMLRRSSMSSSTLRNARATRSYKPTSALSFKIRYDTTQTTPSLLPTLKWHHIVLHGIGVLTGEANGGSVLQIIARLDLEICTNPMRNVVGKFAGVAASTGCACCWQNQGSTPCLKKVHVDHFLFLL